MRTLYLFVALALLSCFGCGKKTEEGRRVGVDASWYPLQFGPRDNNVTAFSTELLAEIGRIENIPFVKVTVNWDDLMQGLQNDKYEVILTSMPPYIFNEKLFDFSAIYLQLGPVLLVPTNSKINSLNMLAGKEVAVISGSNNDLLLQKIPEVLIRYYNSIPEALNAILIDKVDGAVIDVLSAVAYCNDLYQGQLKIATAPLNDEGLRMISKQGKSADLIKGFNNGLKKMKKDGSYDKLLAKWGLKESNPH